MRFVLSIIPFHFNHSIRAHRPSIVIVSESRNASSVRGGRNVASPRAIHRLLGRRIVGWRTATSPVEWDRLFPASRDESFAAGWRLEIIKNLIPVSYDIKKQKTDTFSDWTGQKRTISWCVRNKFRYWNLLCRVGRFLPRGASQWMAFDDKSAQAFQMIRPPDPNRGSYCVFVCVSRLITPRESFALFIRTRTHKHT